jgi:hypothetical protein
MRRSEMKVSELIVRLSELNQDADVCFDTEAQTYDVHLVSIDSAWPIPAEAIGREVVCLHEHADHRCDNRDARISALESQLAAARERIKLFENLLTTMPSYGELVEAAGLAIVTQDELASLAAAGYADGARAFAEIRERLEMARHCLADGEHCKTEQVENQAMRHIVAALDLVAAQGTEEVKPNNHLVARLCYLCEAQFDADPGDARVLCEKCEEETGCRR